MCEYITPCTNQDRGLLVNMSKQGFHKLLVLFVVVVLVIFLVVARAVFRDIMQPSTTRYIIAILMVAALVSMLVLYCNRRKYGTTASSHDTQPHPHPARLVGSDRIDDFLERYTSTISIYVFGAGSLCLRMFYLLASIQCFHYYWAYLDLTNVTTVSLHDGKTIPLKPLERAGDPLKDEEVSRLILHVISILFFAFQLPFLQLFSRFQRLRQSFRLHNMILIIIAADIAQWLYTFLRESGLLSTYYFETATEVDWTSLPKACLDHSTVMNIFMSNTLEPSLFPLTLEFLLVSGEILIHAWFLSYGPAPPTPAHSPSLRRRSRRQRTRRAGYSAGSFDASSPLLSGENGSSVSNYSGNVDTPVLASSIQTREEPTEFDLIQVSGQHKAKIESSSEPIPGPSKISSEETTCEHVQRGQQEMPGSSFSQLKPGSESINDSRGMLISEDSHESVSKSSLSPSATTEEHLEERNQALMEYVDMPDMLPRSVLNHCANPGVQAYPVRTLELGPTSGLNLGREKLVDPPSDMDCIVYLSSSSTDSDSNESTLGIENGAVRVGFVGITDTTIESDLPPEWHHTNSRWNKLWMTFLKAFNIYAALLCILIEGVVVKYFLLHEGIADTHEEYLNREGFEMDVKLPTLVVRITFVCIPSLIVVAHCFAVMRTFRELRTNASGLQGGDIILILAAIGVIGLTFSEFIMCVSNIDHKGFENGWIYVISAFESLLFMPQIILTALVIRLGLTRVGNVSHRYFGTLQRALSYLAMYSFGCWIIDSFLEMDYLIHREDFPEAWEACVHFFLPFCIYFRFVSVLLLLKVKRLLRHSKETFAMLHGQPEHLLRASMSRSDNILSLSTLNTSRSTRTSFARSLTRYGTVQM